MKDNIQQAVTIASGTEIQSVLRIIALSGKPCAPAVEQGIVIRRQPSKILDASNSNEPCRKILGDIGRRIQQSKAELFGLNLLGSYRLHAGPGSARSPGGGTVGPGISSGS